MNLFVLLLLFWPQAPGAQPQAQSRPAGKSIEELRANYANHFLDVESHIDLAKFIHDHGDRLTAFYIMENARRTRAPAEEFNEAFRTRFLGKEPFDASEAGEKKLQAAVAKTPSDTKLLLRLADIYISRSDWVKARSWLEKAAASAPDDDTPITVLAEVLRLDKQSAAAEKLVADFLKQHPKSLPWYKQQIEPILRSDPAKAKKLLLEAQALFPNNASLVFNFGVACQNAGDNAAAEKNFRSAAKMDPNDDHIQGWTARFLLKVKEDRKSALEYYLNAYFLNPDFYDSEHAEQRVRTLNYDFAVETLTARQAKGASLIELLRDKNPAVASLAIEQASKKWDAANVPALLEAMKHDDDEVRWGATKALMNHVDRGFDEKLRALLKDTDLRRRGLAAYIAVHLWKAESFTALRPLLTSNCELLRFEALSALVQEGGDEGRQRVLEHIKSEKNAKLRDVFRSLEKAGKQAP